ncbi:hypothetical protein LCGC14_1745280 [marine sediment metagenome]|uniref:DUF1922 domain-containing protein n=1 Tax=marine sediment metagenome TaxID=412755 RepID=A0A0F9K531_9ZZZZ
MSDDMNMEEMTWKRDETPYIIFSCKKCGQYTYAKETQKSKKCLRCGRSHIVARIKNLGETVKGMTSAVKAVKLKQNKLAIKELGNEPEFRTLSDFKITNKISPKKPILTEFQVKDYERNEDDYLDSFKEMLLELSKSYRKFPLYMVELIAENYNIPDKELKLLIRNFQKKKMLILKNNLFHINF